MKFQLTDIQFDCILENEDDWNKYDATECAKQLENVYIGTTWEGDNEDDVINTITEGSGWCILSADFIKLQSNS